VSPLADEVLLVDGGSTDDTREIASRYANVRLLPRPFDGNFARQRNFGIDHARSEWVFFLDTDELLGPNLVEILPDLLECPFDCARFPRYWLSQEHPPLYVETQKLYPNPQTRLIRNRPEIRFDETRPVHEKIPPEVRGSRLTVKNCHILHYCFAWTSAEQRRRKVEFYESVHGPSEDINYVYPYEDSPYNLRPCRESWRDGAPEIQNRFDPLRERIRIRIWSRLVFPLARTLSAWGLRPGRSRSFTKNPG
jgi:glycosyltransferase involved in cell wall biosynthesis